MTMMQFKIIRRNIDAPMFVGQDIVSYDRAQVPWVSQTNYYQTVTTENMTIFNVGDCVSTQLNGLIVSTSQIAVNNGSALVLQHIKAIHLDIFNINSRRELIFQMVNRPM